ncbi:alpha-2-macroglobulin family protein [Chelatococcus reniformis]|uniref:Alpha-2-macroglobulin n=1 Tax=Chelatococcus reniformis TaxID=1494448 RepID=A0A916TZV3_9HYPH|nr:alpha-2-macroglobulin [Chelatococcus reniformis]GGC54872.1 alpha-2-macroglobulin [Chelatococcus reniformis]
MRGLRLTCLNGPAVRAVAAAAALAFACLLGQQARAEKSFVREELASGAVRLETTLRSESGRTAQAALAAGRDADLLKRESAAQLGRDPRVALTRASEAIALAGKDPGAWIAYSKAALQVQREGVRDRYLLRERATIAAYAAYQAATTKADEAAALAQLGAAFETREIWRPSLDAYAASLALADNGRLRTTYEELRSKYGFRITDYKVDSDSASPRVCFEFSDPLARKTDFAPYVALSGAANAAVSGEDRQLCVDGLKHGERYAIVLRQGLPSSVGESLLKSADYEIYVRDRSPQVRFTGRNYVLPRAGQEGIPVITVNTPKVKLDIARIGDRSLLPTVRSEDFLAQLSQQGIDAILTEKGFKVWSGTLDAKSELNKDVVTAFPIVEAVNGKLDPGVYVMTALPANADGTADGGDDYSQRATQWFVVSDIGLTAMSGKEGVDVLARSLASAEPLAGIEIKLVARNNEVLATRATDTAGRVRFDPGLARGEGGLAPGLVVASGPESDYGFLDLQQNAFDLTDRGVSGRAAPAALDAFLFAERGVYRSGETVHLTSLLRDGKGIAVPRVPLTLVVRRPDGVEYRRSQVEDQGLGGRALSIPLLSGSQSGTWRVLAYTDPKGKPVGETSFLVDDYVPERLEVKLTPKTAVLRPGEPATIAVEARYLFGAAGSDLAVSGEVAVSEADGTAVPGLDGYEVGVADEDYEDGSSEIEAGVKTDAKGHASIDVPMEELPQDRPFQATLTLRVGEEGGRAVARSVTLPILPRDPVIGVKKLFSQLAEGSAASFDVVVADPDGRRLAKPLQWSLYRIDRRYQWYSSDGRWTSEPTEQRRRVADGTVDAPADAPARISSPVEWGSYRLDVAMAGQQPALTSVSFTVGYSGEVAADAPDVLDVKLDKAAYRAGDDLTLHINSRFSGSATVAIVGDRVYQERTVALAAGGTTVSLPVEAGWGAGAYAMAFAYRPLDRAANRMPGRAMGLSWFSIDREAHELKVALDAPATMRPRGKLAIPVSVTGLAPGEVAFITVAAVDVGILNLTRYEAPQPQQFYFGQRQLATDVRDLYGFLIDGMQGARGAIRSGGDSGMSLSGDAPTQPPLARYSGVVKVGPDGKATVSFDIPDFNGSVRIMATAWAGGKVGSGTQDVTVRDPVVLTPTAPRFMAIGDRSRLFVQVDNVEGPAGDYTFDLDMRGPIVVPADAAHKQIRLAAGGRAAIAIPLTAAGTGTASFEARLSGNGVDSRQTVQFRVHPGTPALVRRTVRPLPAGASVALSSDLFADMIPGSGRLSVTVASNAAFDVPALLQALDRYPYGCTEQTVSRALPLLYVNQLAQAQQLAIDPDVTPRITDAIARVLSRQDGNGSFGLWSVGGDDIWLDAFVGDFLTRARERGFAVPQRSLDLALERLRNTVANAGDFTASQSEGLAYAVYVLARNRRPVMGDLRYFADTKLGDFATPLARAQIGAALALLGDRGRAQTAFGAAADALAAARDGGVSRPDYGSRLRDGAALIALGAEAGVARDTIQKASFVVEQARAAVQHTSTQENAWMVLAAEAAGRDANALSVAVDGQANSGPLFRSFGESDLAKPVTIANAGQEPAQLVMSVGGNPATPEGPAAQGYTVERSYYRLDGSKVDPTKVQQNDRLVVALKITEATAAYARLLVVDHLPAGFEIDNPNLVDGSSMEAFAWLKQDGVAPVATEYRDDRFVAAYNRDKGQPAFINVAYIVRVVSPGRFMHPPATAEDMYRPDRYGRTGFGVVEVAKAP